MCVFFSHFTPCMWDTLFQLIKSTIACGDYCLCVFYWLAFRPSKGITMKYWQMYKVLGKGPTCLFNQWNAWVQLVSGLKKKYWDTNKIELNVREEEWYNLLLGYEVQSRVRFIASNIYSNIGVAIHLFTFEDTCALLFYIFVPFAFLYTPQRSLVS